MSWQTIVKKNNLAVSQIPFDEVLKINRLDAEYFDPLYLEQDSILDTKNPTSISKYVDVSDGNHLSITEHFIEKGGVPYFRGQDVNNIFLKSANPMRIPRETYQKGWMKRSHFKANDILLSIVGTIGGLSFVPEDLGDASGSCKIAILRPKETSFAKIVMVFLLGKYGQYQLKRMTRGAVQMGIILQDIPKIVIPDFSDKIALAVDNLITKVFESEAKSRELYTEAEQLLLKEITLEGYKATDEGISVRNLSNCLADNRFDAEYWQPKFDYLTMKLTKNSNRLGDVCRVIKCGSMNYDENGLYRVIKTKQLKNRFIDYEGSIDRTDKGREINDQDLLFASMGVGSLGKIDIFYSEVYGGKYVIDSTLFLLRELKSLTPECLLTLLRLKPYQDLIYRYIVGSSGIISISKDDFERLPVPFIAGPVQKKVTELIKKYHLEQVEAERLLEKTKRAIEIFVEKDEKEALKYLV